MEASIQVWGKGYRVTSDTEEFQRYVPSGNERESGLEMTLRGTVWGPILEELYGVPDRELSAQRCVLFDPNELMTLAFARTADRHGRPSLVLVAAGTQIQWQDTQLGEITSRVVSLATRLACDYADVFKGNPENVGAQLRGGSFLPSRVFDLSRETPDASVEWPLVLSGVRQWRGITGVATTRLLALGANITLGTRYEAEKARAINRVDGYYDVREKEIRPLSEKLGKWPEAQPVPPERPGRAQSAGEPNPILDSLTRIEGQLERLIALTEKVIDQGPRVEKRKKGLW